MPFLYYGVHDGADLTEVPWKRGRGYDVEGLTNVYTANDAWARLVLAQLEKRVDDPGRMRALGFCVSIAHARFMARVFGDLGVPSSAVWGDSSEEERARALRDLKAGRIRVLFSVDLFTEGVDLPEVDTLLLLRPTDSATLFLQQLGRGLRTVEGKEYCLVLDFVGLHRREFRFDRRLRALLGGSRSNLQRQVEAGFPFLPAGCHMELEPRAREIVLRSLREAVPAQWTVRVEELRRQSADGPVGLGRFLEESGLELPDVYSGGRCWSDLQEAAGIAVAPPGPDEAALRRACGRLLHVDDLERLTVYREVVTADATPPLDDWASRRGRLVRMLVAAIVEKVASKDEDLAAGLARLRRHPQVRAELAELFGLLADRIDHHHTRLDAHPDVPLNVHARYSRREILGAFVPKPAAKVPPWQTGVYLAKEARSDLLALTLDKTSGQFSPTTRYRDYAVNRELIHWESQSMTREESETGRRYRRHVEEGSSVMLFARERANDRAFWFLGPAAYVRHEGEQPMAITWRLAVPLPGDLYQSFAAAVA